MSTNDTMHPCGPNMLHPSNCGYDIRATCPTGSVATGQCSVNHPSALGECSVSATKSGQTTSAHLQMKIGRNKRIECSVPQCKCVYQL